MMLPKKPIDAIWSEEQWAAIHHSGERILVNAGAGSGKTAVLTERILEKLKKGIPLESLIVLTFTKAAASEMKERLREKMKEAIEAGYRLEGELEFIDQASIQTFDSFALGMVKKYHYLLNIPKQIGIGDSVVFEIMKRDILEKVLEEEYRLGRSDFFSFVDFFTIKNDETLKKYLLNIYQKLELLSDVDSYFDMLLDSYQKEQIAKNVCKFELFLQKEIKHLSLMISNLETLATSEEAVEHVATVKECFFRLFHATTYEQMISSLDISLPRIPKKMESDEKEILQYEKEQIKKALEKIASYFSAPSLDSLIQEVESKKEMVATIVRILKEFDTRLKQQKTKRNAYEFLDIAKMAIKLVKTYPNVCGEYKESIHEILIDEYQDTSDLQEELIQLIEHNNVYMVGDMKQSIYRFRNANPEIFKTKYQLFREHQGGFAIDLLKNFRSREEVLEDINQIFVPVMDLDLGGVDYSNGHMLTFGNTSYETNKPSQNYHIEFLSYNMEEYEGYSHHEIEAFSCARTILHMIDENYQIFDKKKKTYHNASYGDFVILTSDKKQYELYKKIFEYYKIPLMVHKEESFVKSDEIYVIKNLLKVIYSLGDREYYKVHFRDSLLSVLRSFVMRLSDEEISTIYDGDIIEALKLRYNEFYLKLICLSKQTRKLTVGQILIQIYQEFQIYSKLVLLGEVEAREDKLNFLVSKFQQLSDSGYRLLDCITYLEMVIYEDMDIEYIKGGEISREVVNVMSIHKSKGLEFPVCFFLGMSQAFNMSDLNDRILFDCEYGIILPTFEEGLKDTFYKTLLKMKTKQEEISERMRLLYVALTRAQEKMIVILPEFFNPVNYHQLQIPLAHRLTYKSFFHIFQSLKYILEDHIKKIRLSDTEITKDYLKVTPLERVKKKTEYAKRVYLDVSLEKEELKTYRASKSLLKLITKEEKEALEFGTKIHEYLEYIDFTKSPLMQINVLEESEFIKGKLKAFFLSDYISSLKIIRTYHEFSFMMKVEEKELNGIMDLILETEEELIVIDYKTSNLEHKEYLDQVNSYKTYLKSVSNKKVSGYLYSLMKEEFKKV